MQNLLRFSEPTIFMHFYPLRRLNNNIASVCLPTEHAWTNSDRRVGAPSLTDDRSIAGLHDERLWNVKTSVIHLPLSLSLYIYIYIYVPSATFVSLRRVTFEMRAQKRLVRLHVKCPLLLTDFMKGSNIWTHFSKTRQYQI
jgi:hypothetical protein